MDELKWFVIAPLVGTPKAQSDSRYLNARAFPWEVIEEGRHLLMKTNPPGDLGVYHL